MVSSSDASYDAATAAIYHRDYGRALDLLQVALERHPGDVRVLNAFGVVYDKLGRFDLSARYYARALALGPTSSVLANNMAYSHQLQGEHQTGTPTSDRADYAQRQPAGVHAERPHAIAGLAPYPTFTPREASTFAQVRIETPSLTPATTKLAPVPGGTVVLINATGLQNGDHHLRARLVALGWSVSKTSPVKRHGEALTSISYAAGRAAAAKALARSLPGKVRVAACSDACVGIRLTMGADASTWKLGVSHARLQRRAHSSEGPDLA
jgi:tetratricopeptide (TPR) repeat protein